MNDVETKKSPNNDREDLRDSFRRIRLTWPFDNKPIPSDPADECLLEVRDKRGKPILKESL